MCEYLLNHELSIAQIPSSFERAINAVPNMIDDVRNKDIPYEVMEAYELRYGANKCKDMVITRISQQFLVKITLYSYL